MAEGIEKEGRRAAGGDGLTPLGRIETSRRRERPPGGNFGRHFCVKV